MSAITLQMRRISEVRARTPSNYSDKCLKVECDMTEEDMREAFGNFLEHITCETLHAWLREFDVYPEAAMNNPHEQALKELPLTIQFSAAYIDGVMEGEPAEVRKHWNAIREHLSALNAEPTKEPVSGAVDERNRVAAKLRDGSIASNVDEAFENGVKFALSRAQPAAQTAVPEGMRGQLLDVLRLAKEFEQHPGGTHLPANKWFELHEKLDAAIALLSVAPQPAAQVGEQEIVAWKRIDCNDLTDNPEAVAMAPNEWRALTYAAHPQSAQAEESK